MSLLAHRPRAVAFDVNETLFDLSGLRSSFDRLGFPAHGLDWWFALLLRDGLALAAAGDSAPFPSLAAVSLDEVFATLGHPTPPGAVEAVLAAFGKLPAHGDVVPAFERLKDAGMPVLALTNGGADSTAGLIEAAGLSSLVSRVLSVESVGHWKPRAEPYQWAASKVGVEPTRLAMVAVHPWDLHGAAKAGLVTGWANRNRRVFPTVFAHPHVQAPSLDGVVERLLALPEQ